MKNSDKIIETVTKYLESSIHQWKLAGFVSEDNLIYTFGSDSKILGRAFEVLAKTVLEKAAQDLGYSLYESEKQTFYPDFWFELKNGERIAIDIKTTYRKGPNTAFGFTGGSYTSYLRESTKNINGDYKDYIKHYILGIVYTRDKNASSGIYPLSELSNITPAYNSVEAFIQEKYKMCGTAKGSGNTDNIGTIKATTLEPFKEGTGPFSILGQEAFEDYWKHYPKYKDSEEIRNNLYSNLSTYIEWVRKKDSDRADCLNEKFEAYIEFISTLRTNETIEINI